MFATRHDWGKFMMASLCCHLVTIPCERFLTLISSANNLTQTTVLSMCTWHLHQSQFATRLIIFFHTSPDHSLHLWDRFSVSETLCWHMIMSAETQVGRHIDSNQTWAWITAGMFKHISNCVIFSHSPQQITRQERPRSMEVILPSAMSQSICAA